MKAPETTGMIVSTENGFPGIGKRDGLHTVGKGFGFPAIGDTDADEGKDPSYEEGALPL